jgi:hypothetical protein
LEGLDVPTYEECQEYALPFANHVKTMIHNTEEANVLLDWLAYLLQSPNERPTFSPLIISEIRGVGKDRITDIFTLVLGYKYAKKSSMKELSSSDSWGDVFHKTKLVIVSECGSAEDRYTVGNNLKDAITTTSMRINMKGGKVLYGKAYAGIIFFSNSTSPFRLDKGDRRFFITRCDWTKEEADAYKMNGYFDKLSSYYENNPTHLNGLYHYFLDRKINTDMKGDARMTSTKQLMMTSEPNDVERFFIALRKHPCRYWTKTMIDELFQKENGLNLDLDSKQYKHFMGELIGIEYKINFNKKTGRLKTFSMKDAEQNRKFIRQNVKDNWGITTGSLNPHPESPVDLSPDDDLDLYHSESATEEEQPDSNALYDKTFFSDGSVSFDSTSVQ